MTTTVKETETAATIGIFRGNLSFTLMSQEAKHPAKLALRKWLSANGVPSTQAARLSFAELENAWNDCSNASLNILRLSTETATDNGEAAAVTTTAKVNNNTNANDAANVLAPLLDFIAARTAGNVNEDKVRAIVNEALAGIPPRVIEIHQNGIATHRIEGHVHPKFEMLLKVASSRQANGRHPNIMLSGPTGSGKTHAVEALAKALGLEFYTNGAISMDHQLVGFKDAAGQYHETALRKAFGRPAVYLFDEIDSSDNSPLLCLAGALANGGFEFPDVFVERHPDSIIIAAGNTWGNGATADFVGRNKLDGAIKSRFPVRISWGYDEELERQISGNVAWAKRVQKARAAAGKIGIKVQIDPRMTQAGAAIIAAGMSENEAADLTYLAELTPDQRRMIEAA
jgi:hypothetical protein